MTKQRVLNITIIHKVVKKKIRYFNPLFQLIFFFIIYHHPHLFFSFTYFTFSFSFSSYCGFGLSLRRSRRHCAPGRTSRRNQTLIGCLKPCDVCLTPPLWQMSRRMLVFPQFRRLLIQLPLRQLPLLPSHSQSPLN